MSSVSLLSARYLVPVRPANRVLQHHTVVLQNQKIREILPTAEARIRYQNAVETRLDHHALLPGLINMHTHSPMTLLRGYADDMEMQTWLQDRIWPAESRHVSAAFVADGVQLAIAEMLRAGTTCFNEQYFFPEVMADVVHECGIRAVIGVPVLDLPTVWSSSAADCLAKAEKLMANLAGADRLTLALAPHAPYTVGDDSFFAIARLSRDCNMRVNLHLLETRYDVSHSLAEHLQRPLQRLQRLGLLNNRLLAVHMTQLELTDIDLLAESGVHVIHCPRSNLKLASGHCPITELLDAGINVSIGTDGAASNNRLDLLAEAQTAVLLAKGHSGKATSVDSFALLEMLTINAAKALGQGDTLGSIEAGKWADLVALDLAQPETQPIHNVVSQIAYAASSSQFTDVWVAGEPLLQNRVLTRINLTEILDKAEAWRLRISAETD